MKVGDWPGSFLLKHCGIALVLILHWWCWQGFGLLQLKKLLLVGWVQLLLCRLSEQLCSSGWNTFEWFVEVLRLSREARLGLQGVLCVPQPTRSPTAVTGWLAAAWHCLGWRKSIFSLSPERSDQPWGAKQGNPLISELLCARFKIRTLWNWNLSRKGVYGALSIVLFLQNTRSYTGAQRERFCDPKSYLSCFFWGGPLGSWQIPLRAHSGRGEGLQVATRPSRRVTWAKLWAARSPVFVQYSRKETLMWEDIAFN